MNETVVLNNPTIYVLFQIKHKLKCYQAYSEIIRNAIHLN